MEARAPGSRRSHGVEEAQEDSPAEESQVYGILWQVVVVGSHSTCHAEEDSFGEEGRLLYREGTPVVLSTPERVGFYRSRGHRCGDLHDACFLRG